MLEFNISTYEQQMYGFCEWDPAGNFTAFEDDYHSPHLTGFHKYMEDQLRKANSTYITLTEAYTKGGKATIRAVQAYLKDHDDVRRRLQLLQISPSHYAHLRLDSDED